MSSALPHELRFMIDVISTAGTVTQLYANLNQSATNLAPDSAGGRYMFNNTADGVVRLDTQSGQVSLCSQKGVSWVCEAAPEDRAGLENEIARTRKALQETTAKKKALERSAQ